MAVLRSCENIVANVPKVVVFPFHKCCGTKKAPLKGAYIYYFVSDKLAVHRR